MVDKRAAIQEAFVGGIAGLAVVSAYIVFSAWSKANATDMLDFAGALIGAGLAVGGSMFVIQWQRDSEQREERALLLELLADVDRNCRPFQVANEAALRERYGRTARQQVAEVQGAIARVHEFRQHLKPRTAKMMRVASALADLAFEDHDIDGHLTALSMYPNDADLGLLNGIGHDVTTQTDAARRILNG